MCRGGERARTREPEQSIIFVQASDREKARERGAHVYTLETLKTCEGAQLLEYMYVHISDINICSHTYIHIYIYDIYTQRKRARESGYLASEDNDCFK